MCKQVKVVFLMLMNLVIRGNTPNQTLLRLSWMNKLECCCGKRLGARLGTLEFAWWLFWSLSFSEYFLSHKVRTFSYDCYFQ